MRRTVLHVVCFMAFCALPLAAQTPTPVWGTSGPQSGAAQYVGSNKDYILPFPETTLSGNFIFVALIYDSGNTLSSVTTEDASGATVDTLTQVITFTSTNSNIMRLYVKYNGAGGAVRAKANFSSAGTGFVAMQAAQFYNVGTTTSGTASCRTVTSGTVNFSNNITVASGGLLIQAMFPDDTTASGALTAGSGFSFLSTDRNDSEAMQWRLGTGSGINPAITQATSHQTVTCRAGFTTATSGTAPTAPIRIAHMAHAQMPAGSATPFHLQVPIENDLAVIMMHGGGNTISSLTSTPSNTWTCSSAAIQGFNSSQYCYAPITSPSNAMDITINHLGTGSSDMTLMTYDVKGTAGSPFDVDASFNSSTTSSGPSVTVCSSCLTPTTSNGLVFAETGWDWCTARGSPSPSGSRFDSATWNGNHIDGAQPVDQNNGWLHYYNPNTNPITVTWTIDCTGTIGGPGVGIANYSGHIVAFKGAGGGSTNFPRNVTETASLSESVSRALGATRGITETQSASDSIARVVARTVGISETLSSSDAIGAAQGAGRAASETLSVSDSIARVVARTVGISETLSSSDAIGAAQGAGRAASETLSASDSIARQQTLARLPNEVLSLSDSIGASATHPRAIVESSTPSDSLSAAATRVRSLTESAATSDVINVASSRRITESGSIEDLITASKNGGTTSWSRGVTETISSSDAIARTLSLGRGSTETLSLADAVSRTLGARRPAVTETVTSTDGLSRTLGAHRSITDTVTPTDGVTRTVAYARVMTETLTASDAISRPSGQRRRVVVIQ